MPIFLAVMIIFPLIAAILLKSRYLSVISALALVNFAVLAFDYKQYMLPERQCVTKGLGNCDSHFSTLLMLFTFIVLVGIIMWYLAFKQKENISGLAAQKTTKIALTTTGWFIVAFVILVVIGFMVAFSQI